MSAVGELQYEGEKGHEDVLLLGAMHRRRRFKSVESESPLALSSLGYRLLCKVMSDNGVTFAVTVTLTQDGYLRQT